MCIYYINKTSRQLIKNNKIRNIVHCKYLAEYVEDSYQNYLKTVRLF